MTNVGQPPKSRQRRCSLGRLVLPVSLAVFTAAGPALADESGASFWLLGTYATQAAVPSDAGLSVDLSFYAAGAGADRAASFARGGRIELGLDTRSTNFMLTPTYAFETPVLGGQFSFGVTVLAGNYSSLVSATLVAPSGAGLSGGKTPEQAKATAMPA